MAGVLPSYTSCQPLYSSKAETFVFRKPTSLSCKRTRASVRVPQETDDKLKRVMEESSMEGPFMKVAQVKRKAVTMVKHQDLQKQKAIATPSVRDKRAERVPEQVRGIVEGGVLNFRGNVLLPNLETKYSFLALSASSDYFLVPPTGPNQQEARGHGSRVGTVLRGQPPGIWRRKGQRVDLEDRWRISSAKPVLGDLGRLFWAVYQRSYSRCPRISEVLTHSLL